MTFTLPEVSNGKGILKKKQNSSDIAQQQPMLKNQVSTFKMEGKIDKNRIYSNPVNG